jgi:hypothetical protein
MIKWWSFSGEEFPTTKLQCTTPSASLEKDIIHYVNFIGYFAWYFTAKRTNAAFSERNITIYDKLVVSWLKHVENIVKAPFAQSVFVVASKR